MEIKRHTYEPVLLKHSGSYVAYLENPVELAHVQSQILEENLDGFTVTYKDQESPINSYGVIQPWPTGMWNEEADLIAKRILAAIEKRKERDDTFYIRK